MEIKGIWYNPNRVTSISKIIIDDVSKRDALDNVLKPLTSISFRIYFDYFDIYGNRENILIEEIFDSPLDDENLIKFTNLRSNYIHYIKKTTFIKT